MIRLLARSLLLVLSLAIAHAEIPAPLDDAGRRAVVEAAAKALRDRYVYPEVGEKAAASIEAALTAGSYDKIAEPAGFAKRLTMDLEKVAHDKHMYVDAPLGPPAVGTGQTAPPPQPLSEAGVVRADRLADHIGYIEIFAFAPLDMFKRPVGRAMAALAGTRALIVDVRRNIGGDPASVNYLLSFFLHKAPIHLGTSVSRTPGTDTFTTQEYWIKSLPAISYAGKPVFVLTSSGTFSGGEALAFDMQKLKLGTLVGESTGGGAHLTSTVPLVGGFLMSVPYARGTGASWEGTGVSPDIETSSADALTIALKRLHLDTVSRDIDSLSQARVFAPRTTAAPGGEAAVRRMTYELQRGEPNYRLLNQEMANALRERLPALHDMFMRLGAIQSVTFLEKDAIYGDIYKMVLTKGSVIWFVGLDPGRKVVMWEVRPAPT